MRVVCERYLCGGAGVGVGVSFEVGGRAVAGVNVQMMAGLRGVVAGVNGRSGGRGDGWGWWAGAVGLVMKE